MYSFIVTTPQSVLDVSLLKNKALLNKISDLFLQLSVPLRGLAPQLYSLLLFLSLRLQVPHKRLLLPPRPPAKKKKGLSL